MKELFEAVQADDLPRLERLLAEDPARAHARNERGVSLLMTAAYFRREAMLAALLQAGAEPDLFEATVVGDVARVRALLAKDPGAARRVSSDGFPALTLAAHFGQRAVVELLLDAGADLEAVAEHPMRVRALHSAVASRETAHILGVVTTLVARGADVNSRQEGGWAPLHEAASRDLLDVARLLLDNGADPNAAGMDGRTPLKLAPAADSATARLLVERGATA